MKLYESAYPAHAIIPLFLCQFVLPVNTVIIHTVSLPKNSSTQADILSVCSAQSFAYTIPMHLEKYIGKLNFYCSAVDDILCREGDNRTIGLLLCKSKDRIKAEYALRDIQKPIGISDYELGHALPKDFRGSLPTIEEIEKELASDNQ